MACNCKQKKKKDLAYVRNLAIKSSQINEEDMQIFTLDIPPIGKIYDFEPINPNRNTIIEYIRYNS